MSGPRLCKLHQHRPEASGYDQLQRYRTIGWDDVSIPRARIQRWRFVRYSNTATATTPVPPQSHVGDLDGSATNTKNSWQAAVTVTVHDAVHQGLSGATMTGTWSGGFSGSASCTTDAAGQCVVQTGSISRNKPSVTFTVTNVTSSLTYAAAGNHDPDGSSNGSSITVIKP